MLMLSPVLQLMHQPVPDRLVTIVLDEQLCRFALRAEEVSDEDPLTFAALGFPFYKPVVRFLSQFSRQQAYSAASRSASKLHVRAS
jgi:hypothetical protein